MKLISKIAAVCCILLAGYSIGPAIAQDRPGAAPAQAPAPEQPDEKPAHDPDEILRNSCAFIAELDSFQLRERTLIDIKDEAAPESPGEHIDARFLVSRQKPALAAYRQIDGAPRGISIVADGKTFYAFVPLLNQYLSREIPQTWEALGVAVENAGKASQLLVVNPGMTLLRPDPYSYLKSGSGSSKYLGEVELDGKKCSRLLFEQQIADWEIWIENSATPVLRKMTIDMSKVITEMKRRGEMPPTVQLKFDYSIQLDDWLLNPELSPSVFTFQAPVSATFVEGFMHDPRIADMQPLVSQTAPDFVGKLLDGGTVDMSALKTKNYIVLDFWSTYCGPCVYSMPILIKTIASYKDRGVVLYTVNEMQSAEVIKEFLERYQLNCPVILDSSGEIAMKYQVYSYPHTVIIDKNGKIQAVHIGVNDKLEQKLVEELDALVAGKDLYTIGQAKDAAASAPVAVSNSDDSATSAIK